MRNNLDPLVSSGSVNELNRLPSPRFDRRDTLNVIDIAIMR